VVRGRSDTGEPSLLARREPGRGRRANAMQLVVQNLTKAAIKLAGEKGVSCLVQAYTR